MGSQVRALHRPPPRRRRRRLRWWSILPPFADRNRAGRSVMRVARALAQGMLFLAAGAVAALAAIAVAPSTGTIGTQLTLTGSGFGAAKSRVFLTDPAAAGKPIPLKVTAWSDTS